MQTALSNDYRIKGLFLLELAGLASGYYQV